MAAIETSRFGALRNSLLLRVLLVGGLILLLQIPVSMINVQIVARQQTRDAARIEVTSMWGGEQAIVGPILSIPYTHRWVETTSKGKNIPRQEVRTLRVLPEVLDITAEVASESRYRGIFVFSVYQGSFGIAGHFTKPDFKERGIASNDVQWDRAELALYVSDPRAIQSQVQLSWNGDAIDFTPGAARLGEADRTGIRVALKGRMSAARYDFKIPLSLKGSQILRFAPMAKSTHVALRSNWPHPSFQGNWSPDTRAITKDGFSAAWSIGYLGRNFPQVWQHGEDFSKNICDSLFGVDLNSPVDEYRMAERSVKYALLFLGLTFVLIWLYEVLGTLKVHPIQYLLLGGAICLFYLLLLALAEHIGFGLAYALGAVLVTAQISVYSVTALRSKWRALVMGSVVGGLYVYLYALLQLQDYALLIGALGLFVALAAVMYMTRRVDWYSLQQAVPSPGQEVSDDPSRQ